MMFFPGEVGKEEDLSLCKVEVAKFHSRNMAGQGVVARWPACAM